MLVKLIGLGPMEYWQEPFNRFDAVIVVASLVEMVLSPPSSVFGSFESGVDGGGGGGISVLRTFRLLRMFKLAKSLPELRRLLATIFSTIADIK